MNINFFEWLRDSVRQSVLLGVSDAVEQIGTPPDAEELQPRLAAMLGGDAKPATKASGKAAAKSGGRKRLGKSLKDMNTAPTK